MEKFVDYFVFRLGFRSIIKLYSKDLNFSVDGIIIPYLDRDIWLVQNLLDCYLKENKI